MPSNSSNVYLLCRYIFADLLLGKKTLFVVIKNATNNCFRKNKK